MFDIETPNHPWERSDSYKKNKASKGCLIKGTAVALVSAAALFIISRGSTSEIKSPTPLTDQMMALNQQVNQV